ncbi:MAG: hypothetical protein D3910_20755, partial [Candidatus Electrothrix sp. ATG2]|nr:hypothetical protein [Candidatus Electrothrix sp. ATG2]
IKARLGIVRRIRGQEQGLLIRAPYVDKVFDMDEKDGKTRKVAISTLGSKVNQFESASFFSGFRRRKSGCSRAWKGFWTY